MVEIRDTNEEEIPDEYEDDFVVDVPVPVEN